MAQEIVLRKTSRSGNKVCKTYSITQPSYRFTLETCDNIEATIKDNKGLTVSILSLNAPTALVTKKGNYNICIEGDGVGTLYAEWTSAGTGLPADCCDELRMVDADLQTQINNLKSRVTNLETKVANIINGSTSTGCCDALLTEINNLKERVTELENGGGSGGGSTECCEALETEITNLKNRLTTIEGDITNLKNRVTTVENRLDNQTITGGTGISVTKQGDNYTIVNTSPGDGSGGGGGLPSDFDIQAGENVTVSKSGNTYIISATDSDTIPDVTKAYVDEQIAGIEDADTVTTVVAGTGVTVTDTGTDGNHIYTISATSEGGESTVDHTVEWGNTFGTFGTIKGNKSTYLKFDEGFSVVPTVVSGTTQGGQSSSRTTWTVTAEVTKNYVDQQIAGIAADTNTITTVTAGDGVTVTDNGTDGNHAYTVFATDTKPILEQAFTVTCNIGGIEAGTEYPAGTSLETVLRALLTCPETPQPSEELSWFTSHVVDRSDWSEEWTEFKVDPSLGEYTFDLAATFEEQAVKFDLPASLAPITIYLFNQLTNEWVVNTRDFAFTEITREIDGENVAYLRYNDAREANAVGRPIKIVWNVE